MVYRYGGHLTYAYVATVNTEEPWFLDTVGTLRAARHNTDSELSGHLLQCVQGAQRVIGTSHAVQRRHPVLWRCDWNKSCCTAAPSGSLAV